MQVFNYNFLRAIIKLPFLIFLLFATGNALASEVVLPPMPSESIHYHQISNWTWGLNQLATLLLLVLLVFLGYGTKISDVLNGFTRRRKYLTLSLVTALFLLTDFILRLPLLRFRDNAYHSLMSTEGDPILQWIGMQVSGWIPWLVFVVLGALFVNWRITKNTRTWWIWGACTSTLLVFALFVVEPQFKSYQRLGDSVLETKLSELAGRAGVPRNSIVIDTDPNAEDAHVIGLGPVRLMILSSKALHSKSERWLLQTVAHETKHFAIDDNLNGFYVSAALLFAFFWLAKIISGFIVRKFSYMTGVLTLQQPAAFLVILFVFYFLYLAALPPVNAYRQYVEFEADRFGLEMTRDNEALQQVILGWSTENKFRITDPSVFYKLFRNSHPSDAERMRFANEYSPWRQGERSVYEDDFKESKKK